MITLLKVCTLHIIHYLFPNYMNFTLQSFCISIHFSKKNYQYHSVITLSKTQKYIAMIQGKLIYSTMIGKTLFEAKDQ